AADERGTLVSHLGHPVAGEFLLNGKVPLRRVGWLFAHEPCLDLDTQGNRTIEIDRGEQAIDKQRRCDSRSEVGRVDKGGVQVQTFVVVRLLRFPINPKARADDQAAGTKGLPRKPQLWFKALVIRVDRGSFEIPAADEILQRGKI